VAPTSAMPMHVWLGDELVADLTISRRRVPQLRYRADCVDRRGEGSLGLVIPLPLSRKAYRGEMVDYWIESLLPEGETRTVLENYFRVRRGDGYGLLAALGRDCAGAVAVVPEGEEPSSGDEAGLQPLTEGEVAEEIASLPRHPLGVDEGVRVSLGGFQSKLLLVSTGKGWARPVNGVPSTDILKPDPFAFPGLVASEAFAQRSAAIAGLAAADVRLETIGGRVVLIVTRFDRAVQGGKRVRIHQEDGCQALGVDPTGTGKYQAIDGIASYRRIASVLTGYADAPETELRRLGAMMTFTVAVGNTDAHLRNHSFLHADGMVTLAPIYDAAPTSEFASARQLALWVDDQALLGVIKRANLVAEMSGWGLDTAAAKEVVGTTLEALAESYTQAVEEIPEVPPAVVEQCRVRTENLLRQR
jgi:serine/threonine-protein kinase HipA